MKTAVIFAAYAGDTSESLKNALTYVDILNAKFSDCDWFVGVNPSSKQDKLLNSLEASAIPVGHIHRVAVTPKEMTVFSDVSAYQTALKLLKNECFEYDLLWFIHTKNPSNVYTPKVWLELLGQRQRVESVFLDDPSIGSYALDSAMFPDGYEEKVSQYTPNVTYPFPALPIMHYCTFYVLRGKPVHKFLNNATPDFFNSWIKGDIYYFERDFYQCVFMQGYRPHTVDVSAMNAFWASIPQTREAFHQVVCHWADTGVDFLWRLGQSYGIQQKTEEFKSLMHELLTLRPEVILEIGSYSGGSAVCFSHLCDTLVSCDQGINPNFQNFNNPLCWLRKVVGDSHDPDTLTKVQQALAGKTVDFLFIDGDHSYEGSKRDFEMYSPLATKLIGFHDIVDSESHRQQGCYVSRCWAEIPGQKRVFQAGNQDWGGIGLVEVSTLPSG